MTGQYALYPFLCRASKLFVLILTLFIIAQPARAYLCGNGVLEAGEACDNGANNSDVAANACRTDCRRAYCGDDVKDNGEQCDEGQHNAVANRCRPNCILPRCGDGVTDNATPYNEQCDDANNSNEDGCLNSCRSCVMLGAVGNIDITDDTEICAGKVKLDDYGDYGTIVIKRSGVTLDCNGLELRGEGRGVGIMIFRSNNVTIKNCRIFGYEAGIKGNDSNNVTLVNNYLCGNSSADIDLPGAAQMTGNGNACSKPGNWNDSGRTGCAQRITMCNPPVVKMNQATAMSSAAAQSMKNMAHVTVQPRNSGKQAAAGKTPALRTPAKSGVDRTRTLSAKGSKEKSESGKAMKQPDLAITKASFSKDCKIQLRLESQGAPLSKALYQKGAAKLQREDDNKRALTVPLAGVDNKKALLAGRGVSWVDTRPVHASRTVSYKLIGVDDDANVKNNLVRIRVPKECQAK